jgi:hypothetical protein
MWTNAFAQAAFSVASCAWATAPAFGIIKEPGRERCAHLIPWAAVCVLATTSSLALVFMTWEDLNLLPCTEYRRSNLST